MIYTKGEILALWRTMFTVGEYPEESPLPNIKSHDYKLGTFYCIHCKSWVDALVKVKDKWGCVQCNKVTIGIGRGKTASIYRVTNDLIEYFGPEIKSEWLLDGEMVKGFVKFSGLEDKFRKGDYLLFLSLLRVILSKEIGQLSILDFLGKAERSLNKTPFLPPVPETPEKLEENTSGQQP